MPSSGMPDNLIGQATEEAMNNEIMRQVRGEVVPASRDERRAAREAREIINAVRLRALQVDGAFALAAHIMEEAIQIDRLRRSLARDDISTNILLAEFEEIAIQQAKAIQRGLYNPFGL